MSETEEAAPKKVKPEKSAYEKLSLRHRKYVDERMAGFTGAAAIRRIGFVCKEPKIAAWRLNQLPEIQAAIAEREAEAMEEAGISLTRSWREVACIAYFDKRKLYDAEGNLVPVNELDADTASAISSIEIEETRTGLVRKYKTWSKLEANKLILQKKGEIVERSEDLTPRAPPVIQIVRYPDSKAEGDAGTNSPRAD